MKLRLNSFKSLFQLIKGKFFSVKNTDSSTIVLNNENIEEPSNSNLSYEEQITIENEHFNNNNDSFDNLSPFSKNLSEIDQETQLELLNKDIIYNKENLEILNKFFNDSKFLFDALKPLIDFNLKFSLDITGGAARDFVLGKKVKDLDFMLSINEYSELYSKLSYSNLSKIFDKEDILNSGLFIKNDSNINLSERNPNFVPPEYIFLDYNIDTISSLKRLVIHLCLKKQGIEYNSFFEKNTTTFDKDYPVDKARINSVFKLKSNTNYPIDILLTSLEKPAFIEAFDFNICKASFCIFTNTSSTLLKSFNYNKDFLEKPEFFISRFSATPSFYEDVRNKHISYTFYNKTMNMLQDSFLKHLPRIQEKYPEFNINTIGFNPAFSSAIKSIEEEKELRAEIVNKNIKPAKFKKI